jgi:hypothetical protein
LFLVLFFVAAAARVGFSYIRGLGTFIGICAITGAFGVADADVQGGMTGDLSFMEPEFIQISMCTVSAAIFPYAAVFNVPFWLMKADIFASLPFSFSLASYSSRHSISQPGMETGLDDNDSIFPELTNGYLSICVLHQKVTRFVHFMIELSVSLQ